MVVGERETHDRGSRITGIKWLHVCSGDIIYGMKEWLVEQKKKLAGFYSSYGKMVMVVSLTVGILLVLLLLYHILVLQKLRVTFFDVGQGDAIFIQTPDRHQMLIDGGNGEKILEELSRALPYFDRTLDVVVATHPDADHITGLIPVLEKFQVDTIITSPLPGHTEVFETLKKYITDEQATVRVAKRGDEIIFGDGVVAQILYPSSPYHGSLDETNDASVSMIITYGDESVLLTGDLPTVHEGKLLRDPLPERVTIYKAGHHGSKYSSGEQLLSYIKPEYVVVSAGKDNKYGHPNPEALSRIERYSKEVLSTVVRGTITFLLDGQSVKVKTGR